MYNARTVSHTNRTIPFFGHRIEKVLTCRQRNTGTDLTRLFACCVANLIKINCFTCVKAPGAQKLTRFKLCFFWTWQYIRWILQAMTIFNCCCYCWELAASCLSLPLLPLFIHSKSPITYDLQHIPPCCSLMQMRYTHMVWLSVWLTINFNHSKATNNCLFMYAMKGRVKKRIQRQWVCMCVCLRARAFTKWNKWISEDACDGGWNREKHRREWTKSIRSLPPCVGRAWLFVCLFVRRLLRLHLTCARQCWINHLCSGTRWEPLHDIRNDSHHANWYKQCTKYTVNRAAPALTVFLYWSVSNRLIAQQKPIECVRAYAIDCNRKFNRNSMPYHC